MIRRPFGVSLFCTFAIIAALIDMAFVQMNVWSPGNYQETAWAAAHPLGAKLRMGLSYFWGALAMFSCYFAMQARNWARWTYLGAFTLRYTVAFTLLAVPDKEQDWIYQAFNTSMVPGLLILIFGYAVLFTPNARDYFHAAGRPYWQVEEEEDERKAREGRS